MKFSDFLYTIDEYEQISVLAEGKEINKKIFSVCYSNKEFQKLLYEYSNYEVISFGGYGEGWLWVALET